MSTRPAYLIAYGFLLLMLGFFLAFGMVVRLIEPGFLLSFLSYGASLSGLVMGIYGAVGYLHRRR